MKRKIASLALPIFVGLSFLNVACSDDDSSSKKEVLEVESVFELGTCDENNEGDTVYVKKEYADYVCLKTGWEMIPDSKGTPDESKSSSSEKKGASSASTNDFTKFKSLCKATGGSEKDGVCVCQKELCDVGVVCNTISGVCASRTEHVEESSSSASNSKASSDSKKASSSASAKSSSSVKGGKSSSSGKVEVSSSSEKAEVSSSSGKVEVSSSSEKATSSSSEKEDLTTFTGLCKASGGSEKDGKCVCKETACDGGVLCNTETKECANKVDPVEPECTESYKSTCENSLKGIGIVKECSKGVVVNRSCGLVSCNEEGTDCGECLDDVQTCSEDKNFHATVTRCENGKKVSESCGEKSCDPRDNGCGECTNYEHYCEDSEEDKGTVYECIAGEPKKAVTICGNKSCRKDKPICGECLNGELRCDNDINNNAVMYRCVDGQWERLHNKFDPLDKEYYKCPVACREGYPVDKMEYECDTDQCSNCDPCWGEPMTGVAPTNPNPCYNEERCKQILKDEDPDYPPFRSFETKNKWKDLIPSKKMVAKIVHGYNWNNHKEVTDPKEREEDFEFDLTNETGRVSCNALGTNFGECHNTLQTCINKVYHGEGFMVVCASGELVNADDNNDGIACECEKLGSVNANGCCYTRSACFKSTIWSRDHCDKPTKTDEEDK